MVNDRGESVFVDIWCEFVWRRISGALLARHDELKGNLECRLSLRSVECVVQNQ